MEETVSIPLIEYGSSGKRLLGHTMSGDLHIVKTFAHGAIVGVIDGLGHGEEAAYASKIAASTIQSFANESPIALVRHCHEELKGTRGVVMSIASFDFIRKTVTWLGVGNVEGILFRVHQDSTRVKERILLRGGVVGYQLPLLSSNTLPVKEGDLLILATDGVNSGFSEEVDFTEPVQRIAKKICSRYAKTTDDALVLVIRYIGNDHERNVQRLGGTI